MDALSHERPCFGATRSLGFSPCCCHCADSSPTLVHSFRALEAPQSHPLLKIARALEVRACGDAYCCLFRRLTHANPQYPSYSSFDWLLSHVVEYALRVLKLRTTVQVSRGTLKTLHQQCGELWAGDRTLDLSHAQQVADFVQYCHEQGGQHRDECVPLLQEAREIASGACHDVEKTRRMLLEAP